MAKKRSENQKLMKEDGEMVDIIEEDIPKITKSFKTGAFIIKVPKTSVDAAHSKIEKIRNSTKLNQSEKPQAIKDFIVKWVQGKMRPLKEVSGNEWDHDCGVFQEKIFEGYEEVMEQKKLEGD